MTDNHGHADWMPLERARSLFPGPSKEYGGVVVGEAYRVDLDTVAAVRFDPEDRATWGRGGQAPLLIDPCRLGPTHSMVFAGSGSFKTSCAITTIAHWTGSLFVLDPSCEIGPMMAESRAGLKHAVHQMRLDNPECGLNVLDWIDINSALAETHVRSIVWWIAGGEDVAGRSGKSDDGSAFFSRRGHALIACLLAHMLWDESIPREHKTLIMLREGLVTPENEMRHLLRGIRSSSRSLLARDYASTLMGLVDDTFSGVYANADDDTAWLSNQAFAMLVSGDAFKTTDMLGGKATVFLQIPLTALTHTPALARVILGALLNAYFEADGSAVGRGLFLIDEARRLQTMRVMEDARDMGRKYGITLHLLYLSEAQLTEQWGQEGKKAWIEGVSWRGYAAVQDPELAKELCSAVFGDHAVLAYSEGVNKGTSNRGIELGSRSRGSNENVHEIKRSLVRTDELLGDVRSDEMFVIPREGRPMRVGRPIWWRRADMEAIVKDNRFYKGKPNGEKSQRGKGRGLTILGTGLPAGRATGSGGKPASAPGPARVGQQRAIGNEAAD